MTLLAPDALAALARPSVVGQLLKLTDGRAEIAGLPVGVGDLVTIDEARPVTAEVVAVESGRAIVLPLTSLRGHRAGEMVSTLGRQLDAPIGDELLGRVLDGLGHPIDRGPSIGHLPRVEIQGDPPSALHRPMVTTPMTTGVRAIDTLLTCGRGQRVGILAGSGVGKSSLLSMLVRGGDADVNVACLVGERGREVGEFIENDLGPEGLAKTVMIVATSDAPALVRRNAAFLATRIAESFRDRGRHVTLVMDSITRFAMAQREIGLAAGEVPTTRGYPPSVFGLLPQLLERAGTSNAGSITGFYTVLVEGDDLNDPIGDATRSILDGHISLSRDLANAGHFPSIDILQSASRVARAVTTPIQQAIAVDARAVMATHSGARDLIEVGAYAPGTQPEIDRAVAVEPALTAFLRQNLGEASPADQSWLQLDQLLTANPAAHMNAGTPGQTSADHGQPMNDLFATGGSRH